ACLVQATQLGLLVSEDNSYRFSESHFGEMVYDWMDAGQKSFYHYRIAKLLQQRQCSRMTFSKQITMTGHFNQALDQVLKNGELEFCAALIFKRGVCTSRIRSLIRQRCISNSAQTSIKNVLGKKSGIKCGRFIWKGQK